MDPMLKSKSVWMQMVARCTKPRHKRYPYYGGRGIKVCDRWLDYDNFRSDMGEPPKGLWLDRIDNDGNYEPSNCRWATPVEQIRNRRNTKMIEWNGRTLPLAEACEESGVPIKLAHYRVNAKGWSVDQARSRPAGAIKRGKKAVTYAQPNKDECVAAVCRRLNINACAVRTRLSRGWPLEKALSQPIRKRAQKR